MYHKEWHEGDWSIRYDGAETKIDIAGNPTLKELDDIIATLQDARGRRVESLMNTITIKPKV